MSDAVVQVVDGQALAQPAGSELLLQLAITAASDRVAKSGDTMTGLLTLVLGVTSSGAGANSEHFGADSSAAGASGVAVGAFAAAGYASGTALGYDASVTGTLASAVGRSAAAGPSSVAFGYASTVAGTSSVGIGNSSSSPASYAVAIGQTASVASTETYGIAIGSGASITAGATGGGENMAIGGSALAAEWRATAVGWKAKATAISSTALGRGAYSAFTHAIAIGRGGWTNANNQIAIGFSGGDTATDVYFESGHTHKYVDWPDGTTITRTPSLTPIIIHGFDAYDATGAPTNNVAGGPLRLAGGMGTGTAAGGSVVLQVAPAGGVSNNTKNALVDSLVITSAHLATFTGAVTSGGTILAGASSSIGWTGRTLLSSSADGVFGISNNAASSYAYLAAEAANVLAIRNSTNGQMLRVYNTYTDASNYERGEVGFSSNTFYVRAQNAGTGTQRQLVFDGSVVGFRIGGADKAFINGDGHFVSGSSGTGDLGISSNGWRTLYLSQYIRWLGATAINGSIADGNLLLTNNAVADFGLLQFGGTSASFPALKRSGAGLLARTADDSAYAALTALSITVGTAAAMVTTNVALTDGAGVAAGTITNAPAAGNPTKWIPINDNGTTRHVPAW